MITGVALKAVLWIASSVFGKKLSEFAAGAIAAVVIVAAVVGFSSWALYSAYSYGAETTEAKWQAKALQSKLDAANADRDAARKAEGLAKLQVASIANQSKKDRDADAQYIEELKKRPPVKTGGNGCDLTDADRRGMRERSGPNPAATRTSPKARWFKR